MSPLWGLDLGTLGVSIDIPPLWGCSLLPWHLFFCKLDLCEKRSEKSEVLQKHVMN